MEGIYSASVGMSAGMWASSQLSPSRDGAIIQEAVWLVDASGLPQGPARGGAALAGLPVPTHRADRGRL